MSSLPESLPFTPLLVLAIASLLFLTLYRLYLHPLADFPGPKLAAASYWYECYFNVLKGPAPGQYMYQVDRLHETYGASVFRYFGGP